MATLFPRGDTEAHPGGSRPAARASRVLESSFAETSPFVDLSPGERQALVRASSLHRVPRLHLLFCEGEMLERLYIVESGSFKRVRQSKEGKELIVGLLGAGHCFGALGVPTEATAYVEALEDASCVGIDVAAVRQVLAGNPGFAMRLLALLEARSREVEAAMSRMAFDSVPRRLASLLLAASRSGTGELVFPLTQSELASLIGSSRETVCSVLSQFRRAGLIRLARGRVRVLDREGLSELP